MKNYKFLAVMIVVGTIIASGVFAQAKTEADSNWGGKKDFVSIDLYIIGGGARYEHLLTPKISAGANFYYLKNLLSESNALEIGVFGRYYIWEGLFGELGLGLNLHSDETGFAISPGLGWKFDPRRKGGFVVEPGISIPITIGSGADFVLRCSFGWAFRPS